MNTAVQKNEAQLVKIKSELSLLGFHVIENEIANSNTYLKNQYDLNDNIISTIYVADIYIEATMNNIEKAFSVFNQLLDCGSCALTKVVFDIEDTSESISQAKNLVLEDANQKAQAFTSQSSIKIKNTVLLSEFVIENPYTLEGTKNTDQYFPKGYTDHQSLDTDINLCVYTIVKYEFK